MNVTGMREPEQRVSVSPVLEGKQVSDSRVNSLVLRK